jgi:hypothetical protein
MVLAGAALGLRLLSQNPADDLPGAPVAANPVNVAPLPRALPLVTAAAPTYPALPVVHAQSVQQAQSGNPFQVISGVAFQPTAAPDALQPGYQTELRIQGQQGTSPSL